MEVPPPAPAAAPSAEYPECRWVRASCRARRRSVRLFAAARPDHDCAVGAVGQIGLSPVHSSLLRRRLLSGRAALENALRSFEFRTPCRAQILAAAIDEVLNHPDTGSDSFRGHISPRHFLRDFTGTAGECARW